MMRSFNLKTAVDRGANRAGVLAARTALALAWIGFLALAGSLAHAENWPQWRGPDFNGSSSETGLPSKFSKTENVKWTAPMPGPSAATPIVWNDRVFISSADDQKKSVWAFCLNRKTGKTLWEHEVGPGYGQDRQSNYASPSPATDGKLVVFFYGSGELVAFDLDGKQLWARNIQKDYGPFAFNWTFSTSPVLFQNKLYLQVLQRDVPVNGHGRADGPNDSYLLALDPRTGKELWRQIRPCEAREESREAFTTPTPFTDHGRTELLIAGGDCLSGHDADSGKELWRWGTWNPNRITHWRLVPSPTAGGGVALACAPKGSPIYAVKLGLKGTLDESAIGWKSQEREVSTDVSTPLFYKGRFYVLNSDRKTMTCLEPATGKVLWTGKLESRAKIEASPTGADGKIYVMNFRGDVFVMGTGDAFEVLNTAAMGEEGDDHIRSTISVSQGDLFVRAVSKLYCIGTH
jgi:outer membrane protein assembly factor BamB